MRKKYFILLATSILFLSLVSQAQEQRSIAQEPTIEGLSIYPNPVSSGKIYVTTKLGLEKEIQIFDVLGKKVFETKTSSKEINISSLNAGVYIIQIKEKEATSTRKLIIK